MRKTPALIWIIAALLNLYFFFGPHGHWLNLVIAVLALVIGISDLLRKEDEEL